MQVNRKHKETDMERVIQVFMRGQGMDRQEAEDQWQCLLEDMGSAVESGSMFQMEELMYEYGLELDYVEDIAAALTGVA